jgi:uncharacterized membrane protein
MKSTASVAKHPIHPMLVPVPIGLWIFSFIGDVVFQATGNLTWGTIARYSMGVGVIGALLAALPGFVDLYKLPASRAKRMGILHMSVNLGIVVLFAADYVWRVNQVPGALGPFVLSIIGILSLMVSGWLGGEMVYVHGVAVEPVRELQPLEPQAVKGSLAVERRVMARRDKDRRDHRDQDFTGLTPHHP